MNNRSMYAEYLDRITELENANGCLIDQANEAEDKYQILKEYVDTEQRQVGFADNLIRETLAETP